MFIRLLVLLSFVTTSAFADPNQVLNDGRIAYYGDFINQKSNNIKKVLYDIMSSSHLSVKGKVDRIGACEGERSCYRHNQVGYSRARTIMFGELFVDRDNNGMFVEEVYCERKIYYQSVSDISNMHTKVNIEHTWPQSKFSPSYSKELQKSDMHHLFPTDSKANSIRANHRFGESHGYINNDLCAASSIENTHNGLVFTPPEKHRGNVARALFYFSIRYQMPIDSEQELALRQWHAEDPVDQAEIERNNMIAKHQLVRNPFIDFPHLSDEVADF
jgi:deoxyribonuclease-1